MKRCEHCEAPFAKRPNESVADWSQHRFCSIACRFAAPQPRVPLAERLWSRIDRSDPSACWLWTGASTRGGKYGVIGRPGGRSAGNLLTHVAAYLLEVGPIPVGWQIDHLCRVTLCCNPAHLEAVTQAENLRRQQAAITHCFRGHEFTPENTYHPPATPSRRQCRKCNRIRNRAAYARKRAL